MNFAIMKNSGDNPRSFLLLFFVLPDTNRLNSLNVIHIKVNLIGTKIRIMKKLTFLLAILSLSCIDAFAQPMNDDCNGATEIAFAQSEEEAVLNLK